MAKKHEAPRISRKPRDYTEADRRKTVKWLCTLPLSKLRGRQDIIRTQQESLYQQYEREGGTSRILGGFEDLTVMEEMTREAIECVGAEAERKTKKKTTKRKTKKKTKNPSVGQLVARALK